MRVILAVLLLLVVSCVRVPDNIQPVDNFQVNRYLGLWYEIARLDHRFERGLSHVTASYSLRADGGLRVVNRGYSQEQQKWSEAEGRAYFVSEPEQGFLKVSFFGPFYGSYIIFELDRVDYSYALVSGPDKSYLWILSRTPTLPANILRNLIAKASAADYDTDKLIYCEHKPL